MGLQDNPHQGAGAGPAPSGDPAVALGGVDIAWLVGLAVTSIVYAICARSIDVSAEIALERSEGVPLS